MYNPIKNIMKNERSLEPRVVEMMFLNLIREAMGTELQWQEREKSLMSAAWLAMAPPKLKQEPATFNAMYVKKVKWLEFYLVFFMSQYLSDFCDFSIIQKRSKKMYETHGPKKNTLQIVRKHVRLPLSTKNY